MNLAPTRSDIAPSLHPAHDALKVLRFALKRRRRGKIARLPEPVREQINLLLCDGVRYAEIIARLGEACAA